MTMTAYPYQETNSDRCADIIRQFGSCLDASETGTGKTISAIRTAQKLGLKPSVVTTLSGIPAWQDTLKEFGEENAPVINWESARKPTWQLPRGNSREFSIVISRAGMVGVPYRQDHCPAPEF